MKITTLGCAGILILSAAAAFLLMTDSKPDAPLAVEAKSIAVDAPHSVALSKNTPQAHASPDSALPIMKAERSPVAVSSSAFPRPVPSVNPSQVAQLPSPNFSPSSRPTSPNGSAPLRASVSGLTPAGSIQQSSIVKSVDIAVPRGMVLPATFSDSSSDRTSAQAAALDQIANDFLDTALPAGSLASGSGGIPTSQPNEEESQPDSLVTPDPSFAGPSVAADDLLNAGGDVAEARRHANERYRQLFGQEAFNAWSSAAATEALSE
jgi:hypothetical protein